MSVSHGDSSWGFCRADLGGLLFLELAERGPGPLDDVLWTFIFTQLLDDEFSVECRRFGKTFVANVDAHVVANFEQHHTLGSDS